VKFRHLFSWRRVEPIFIIFLRRLLLGSCHCTLPSS